MHLFEGQLGGNLWSQVVSRTVMPDGKKKAKFARMDFNQSSMGSEQEFKLAMRDRAQCENYPCPCLFFRKQRLLSVRLRLTPM